MNKFELIKEVIDFAAPSVKNNAAVLAQKNKEIATKNKIRNNFPFIIRFLYLFEIGF